jgi:16S rRNA (guanine966-N2)-methyltransferase
MQILAGKYKGRRLQSTSSPKVRPTARRLRESLFDTLGPRIENARLLDLCSGSGAVGIEALSRGASHVTFVDHSTKMCAFVRTNLELCGVSEEQFDVVEDDAKHFLNSSVEVTRIFWDMVFYDPPYSADYLAVIETLSTSELLKRKHSALIVEHSFEIKLSDRFDSLKRWRLICQGESCLSFYERR